MDQAAPETDVLILGGGLAGLTLALQLRQREPDLRITVIERRAHPVREAAHKVGESTVEIGAHYFANVLGLRDHLEQEQIRKFGFRFFFSDGRADIDGCTDLSLAGVFTNTKTGFPPCTAQAAMEILHHFGIQIKGKKAAVIGRSLVIGRPVAMMLMHENATVVNCHTRTVDVPSITREADILIAASGQLHSVKKEFTNPDQVVIDVGINWDEAKGGISGDVDFEDVEPNVAAITPVPGGVGSVTTCVLIGHVVEAAKRTL